MKTVEEIKTLIDARKTYYAKLREQQELENGYYELKYDAKVSKIYTQITPDTAREWIHNGVKSFTLDNPRATVPPRKDKQKYRESEAQTEAWCNAWLDFLSMLQPNPIKQNSIYVLLRGECFDKILVDDRFLGIKTTELTSAEKEKLEKDKLNSFPLIVKAPDPMNVYASTAHNYLIPHDVVEMYSRTVEDVMESCERNKWKWDNPRGLSYTDQVVWAEYWSDTQRCYLVGDSKGNLESILSPPIQKNLYGFCPYVHTYSGYGITDYKGRPEYMARGILYGKIDLIKLFTRAISQYDSLMVKYAWPWRYITGETSKLARFLNKEEGDLFTIEVKPDEMLVLPEGVEIVEMQGQAPPAALLNWIQIVKGMIEGPAILNAEAPPGVTAGYPMNILWGAGKATYKSPFKNREDALGVLMGLGIRLVEEIIQEPVGIKTTRVSGDDIVYGEERLDPKIINGYYVCKVKLLSDAPEAMDLRSTQGKQLQLANVISERTNLIEYQNMTQKEADDEIAQKRAEEILRTDPNLRQAMGADALKRLGFEIVEEKIKELTQAGVSQVKTSAELPVTKGRNITEGQYPRELAAEEAAREELIQ